MRVKATASVFLGLTIPANAASIPGPGASSCLKFALDYTKNPPSEEQYFIWAQGYMSAIVMMAPTGCRRYPRPLAGVIPEREPAGLDQECLRAGSAEVLCLCCPGSLPSPGRQGSRLTLTARIPRLGATSRRRARSHTIACCVVMRSNLHDRLWSLLHRVHPLSRRSSATRLVHD